MKIKENNFLVAAAVLCVSLLSCVAIYAWTEPTSTPPNDNVDIPLNSGTTTQSKTGGLNIAGNVGIGTTAPDDKLHIYSGTAGNIYLGEDIGFDGGVDSDFWFMNFGGSGGKTNFTDGTTELMTILNTGNVGIGTTTPSQKLEVNGNIRATAFYYSSDARLKENISPITDPLAKVGLLDGVYFQWKDNGELSIGLIAQDVEKVFPEAVATSKETGIKSVDYAKLVAPLIEAVKAQQEEIGQLKLEIKELKDQVANGQ